MAKKTGGKNAAKNTTAKPGVKAQADAGKAQGSPEPAKDSGTAGKPEAKKEGKSKEAEILAHLDAAQKLLSEVAKGDKRPRPLKLAQRTLEGSREAVQRYFRLK